MSSRLWHLKLCNKVFVIENGGISQQGSFEELTKNDGFFKETLKKQIGMLGINSSMYNIKKTM